MSSLVILATSFFRYHREKLRGSGENRTPTTAWSAFDDNGRVTYINKYRMKAVEEAPADLGSLEEG